MNTAFHFLAELSDFVITKRILITNIIINRMNKAGIAGLQLTLVELLGDTSLKQYATNGNPMLLGVGCASYIGLVYILQDALKTESLAITNGYWDGLSNVLTTGAGIAMGEQISSTQLAGLLLISAGLFML